MFVVLLVLVWVYRQRIFVRDPLGRVERNGVRQENVRVFLNYSNDVMVEDMDVHRHYLVQGWNRMPGVVGHLVCVQGLACFTEADKAETTPLGGTKYRPKVEMTNKQVSFVDGDGALVTVKLR